MKAMKNMGRELKAIADMLAGSTPFDPDLAEKHATALHDVCHKIDLLFPAGSLDHVSHAKPAIWEDPEAFAAEVSRLHDASDALLEAAKSQNESALNISAHEVERACNSCHQRFRQEDH
jgi:cytochrome c556